ncbi:carbon-nitrogen hydrolase family protein [Solimonas variicoloris]|uniref:carbon-nitrogen hydrolase family protein n=1 Tax=Solimonas variicoloris TaxID=254408 RepID=UPI000375070A|nr:carbon-nitrogen hydrolase family protein [Solimonas variicoloris]
MSETARPARLAALQMNSGDDVAANLDAAAQLLREAARAGARVAVLPENFAFMGRRDRDKLAHAEADGHGPIQDRLAALARELDLWIIAGTLPIRVDGEERVYAACCVYDSDGARVARYDKIHLYDIDVPGGGGERYRESASIAPGRLHPVVVDTPAGRVGLSVCYDLRFPELYRALVEAGAEILVVPAAFTVKTGEAHWELLLRARAVENLCYVVAPGQCGTHPSGRGTYGHSLIVEPWGRVVSSRDAGTPGVVTATRDAERQAELRREFPALAHRRLPARF